jgi:hypothetical protein
MFNESLHIEHRAPICRALVPLRVAGSTPGGAFFAQFGLGPPWPRDERRLERRALDPRTGQRRPGESWAEEDRRAAKAEQATERVCARLRGRAG